MKRRQIVIGPDTKLVRTGGRPTRTVGVLLAVIGGLFVLYAFTDGPAWVKDHLMLSAARALGLFQLWQTLTAPWLHLHADALVINVAALWFFGPALDRWWGPRRFLCFYIVTGVTGMIVALLVGLLWPTALVAGAAGSTTAMMVAFAVLFPQHHVFCYGVWPLRGLWLSLVLLAFVAIGNVIGARWLQLALQAGGAVGALLFLFSPRRLIGQARVRRAKRKLNVIDGGKPDGPKYLN